MGKNDPQNNLECKFVHQNHKTKTIDPFTPHNATPAASGISAANKTPLECVLLCLMMPA